MAGFALFFPKTMPFGFFFARQKNYIDGSLSIDTHTGQLPNIKILRRFPNLQTLLLALL